ncbi:uncharacterized protein LOC122792280 [Protopterus annectens]|uniref:uncharacterized protein LOC122792280 n=1 Tax=Protopterus annectens TaxID=7888 RepID=UPI001CFB3358|nr:uncharacterized protein LOC122792280 [Protopterus annectens]
MGPKRKKGTGCEEEPEACEVWLDTSNLRKKKSQPSLFFTKSLNPLAGKKYNIPASLHFTQSKSAQPFTKQTTISTYFTVKQSGNLSASDLISGTAPSSSSSCSSAAIDCMSGFNKLLVDESDINELQHVPTDMDSRGNNCPPVMSEKLVEPEMYPSSSSFSNFLNFKKLNPVNQLNDYPTSLQIDSFEFKNTFKSMPQITGSENSITEMACFVNSLAEPDFTEDSQGYRVIAHDRLCKSPSENIRIENLSTFEELSWVGTTDIENFKLHLLNSEKLRTSTQICNRKLRWKETNAALSEVKLEDTVTEDKENFPTVLQPLTKQKHSCKILPLKQWPEERLVNGKPVCQKLGNGDIKLYSGVEVQTHTSTQALFTQDSQGNRVIAHHIQKAAPVIQKHKMAFRDQTNQDYDRNFKKLAFRSHDTDLSILKSDMESDKEGTDSESQTEWLFTQDSEGNTVIKHSRIV